jgi:hypothetical protein
MEADRPSMSGSALLQSALRPVKPYLLPRFIDAPPQFGPDIRQDESPRGMKPLLLL